MRTRLPPDLLLVVRFFWAIIIGLLVAAGVLLVRPADRGETGPATATTPTEPRRTPAPSTPSVTDTIGDLARQAATDTAPEETPDDTPGDTITATTWTLAEGDTLQDLARRRYGDARLWRRIVDANPGLAAGELKLGDTIQLPDLANIPESDPAAAIIADLDAGREERADDDAEATTTAAATITDPDAPTLDLGLDREIPDGTVERGRLVKLDDAIVADETYTIRGAGTKDDPYRVSWELLASCADGYRPSLGERRIPQRIAALDGAWIRIDGYIAFPLGGSESTELLVMLNQWDGCCIGIPPTPYDAIEATLVEAMPAGQRHAINFGTITGRLSVSPYLVENWLVGLYLMDETEVRIEL
jgi:phage tail protein X